MFRRLFKDAGIKELAKKNTIEAELSWRDNKDIDAAKFFSLEGKKKKERTVETTITMRKAQKRRRGGLKKKS